MISQLVSNKAPSQSEYDNAIDLYNELTDNEKSNVLNADVLTKYNDVNLNAVSQLNTAISKITLSTTFSELLNIKNSYDNLNENGKQFIDIKPVENAMQLTDLEKAAVVAAKYVKKSLKSSDSFILKKAQGINDLNGESAYYLIKLEYSATNSFGATIDDYSFQTISSKFSNPWYGLFGEEALKCSPFIPFYLQNSQEPTEMNCEKIIYYIDEELN